MGGSGGSRRNYRLSCLPGQSRDPRRRHPGLWWIVSTAAVGDLVKVTLAPQQNRKEAFQEFTKFYVAPQHKRGTSLTHGMKREGLMKQHLMRLDRIAGQMNAWLLVIAIGLGMLDLAVLIA